MIYVNVDFIFSGDWSGDAVIHTNKAMGKAILDAFAEGVTYLSGGEEVSPLEQYQEAIEQGITDVTLSLNE